MRQRREPQRVFQRRPLIYPERLLEVLRATGGGGGARELDRRSRRRGCHPRDARALSRCGGLRRTGANAGSRGGSIARGVTPVSTSTTRERNSLSRRSRSGETGSSSIWATRSRSRLTRRPVATQASLRRPRGGRARESGPRKRAGVVIDPSPQQRLPSGHPGRPFATIRLGSP
jgi:hypothetical protein